MLLTWTERAKRKCSICLHKDFNAVLSAVYDYNKHRLTSNFKSRHTKGVKQVSFQALRKKETLNKIITGRSTCKYQKESYQRNTHNNNNKKLKGML